jgi:hypothetical protein
MWRHDDLLDALARGVADAEAALAREQAPYGLDALHELQLHPILAAALVAPAPGPGFGVIREQPYPQEWVGKPSSGKRLRPTPPAPADADTLDAHAPDDECDQSVLPELRDRLRCDLVLTPEPDQTLADPLATVRQADDILRQGAGSLFAAHAETAAAEHVPSPTAVVPEDAFWLEIKTLGQFSYCDGVPGPNTKYGAELVRAIRTDAAKLAEDGMIFHAAVLIVLFAATEEIARHDIAAAIHRCLDRDMPVGSPLFRSVPIADRIGNSVCELALVPVRTI